MPMKKSDGTINIIKELCMERIAFLDKREDFKVKTITALILYKITVVKSVSITKYI